MAHAATSYHDFSSLAIHDFAKHSPPAYAGLHAAEAVAVAQDHVGQQATGDAPAHSNPHSAYGSQDAIPRRSSGSMSNTNTNTNTLTAVAADGDFDLLPPPSGTHTSWQALHDFAQSYAAEHGYALSINTTAKNRSRIKLACVCYGQPKNTHKLTAATRVRKNRVSYKTGCRMWIEGKKQQDGTWLLRVGEPQHNHPGRPSEGWAVQRKRTWGVVGGRVGVGGVTAKEELAKMAGAMKISAENKGDDDDNDDDEDEEAHQDKPSHSLERGGLVWKIVEQEMLRKGEPNQGRDRGVGRTVQVLQTRLPGIHIFKRDVYNIRAQIKRARKAAGQQLGEGVRSDDDEDTEVVEGEPTQDLDAEISDAIEEDQLLPQSTTVSQQETQQHLIATHDFAHYDPALASHQALAACQAENAQLRDEITKLKLLLAERTKALKEKTIEIAGLKVQAEYARTMSLLPG